MDKVTQENAALVERAATAANSLAQEAFGVTQAISLFKFGATGVAGTVQAHQRQSVRAAGAPRGVGARASKGAKLLAA
jgi:aerotaxis receptor